MFCLSAANKGIEADIFVVDEASRVPSDIISEVIAPMLRVKNTVLIMLSTNLGKDNHYSKMFDKAKGEFEPLFIKKQVDLMCENCKRAKKDPSECNHNEHRNPSWLSGASKKRAKFFMTSQSMYAREVLGVVMSDENSVLDSSWLDRLTNKERWSIKFDPTYVLYTYIDPSGSGKGHQSETAICTVIRTPEGKSIILGVASWNTQNEKDTNDFVISYFRNFALHEIYSKMRHVLCVESNYGGALVASWFVNRATHALPTIEQYRPQEGKDGVTLFARNKAEAVMDAIALLDEDRVLVASKLIAPDPRHGEDLLKLLLKQLSNLRKVFEAGRWTYTAKGPGAPDDLCIAYLMSQKFSSDCTILARLNAEQRMLTESLEQQMGYEDIETHQTEYSGRGSFRPRREDDTWCPQYM